MRFLSPVCIVLCTQDNVLPAEEKFEGFSITLKSINRTHAGVYQCTASNGVGDPVTVDMQVDVLCKLNLLIEFVIFTLFIE